MNIEISARGRGNWNDWKLGDSILVCSVLAHISDSINLYTMYPESKGIKLIEKLSHKIYNDKYELNIMSGNFSLATHIYPDQFYLENNVNTVKYFHTNEKEDYTTIQLNSKSSDRCISLTDNLKNKYMEEKTIELSNAHTQYNDIKDLFDVVSKAKNHVGAASGLTWVAMSCGIPTIALLNHNFRVGSKWDYAMECIYRNKNVTVKDLVS